MKIVYITNARLPTEKAHGIQIIRMCEAFSRLGFDVNVIHPWRYQSNNEHRNIKVEDYFNFKDMCECNERSIFKDGIEDVKEGNLDEEITKVTENLMSFKLKKFIKDSLN